MARRDITGAIDFPYLEGFCAGDTGMVAEVLDLFEEQMALWGRLLDPACEGEVWRDGAHTLKGSALGVGAHELATVCGEAEAGWQASRAVKAALKDRLDFATSRAMADIAAWRHERLLRELK